MQTIYRDFVRGKPQAIETVYRSYRFRSRLEARWAVFFDRIGTNWVYEHEGYELPSGRYLPDFFFPESKFFVEVKPGPMPAWCALVASREAILAEELVASLGYYDHALLMVFGDPLEAGEKMAMHGFGCGRCSPAALRQATPLRTAAAVAARQARFEHGAQL